MILIIFFLNKILKFFLISPVKFLCLLLIWIFLILFLYVIFHDPYILEWFQSIFCTHLGCNFGILYWVLVFCNFLLFRCIFYTIIHFKYNIYNTYNADRDIELRQYSLVNRILRRILLIVRWV